jgi:hypothetical protein
MTSDQTMESPDSEPTPEMPPQTKEPLATPPKRVLKKKDGYMSHQDLERLKASIKRRGEAAPGEMAKELGWARSSLAYNLNRLLKNGIILRLGKGRSARYRMATEDEWRAFRQQLAKQESEASQPPVERPQATKPTTAPPQPKGNRPEPEEEAQSPKGSLMRKLILKMLGD